MLFSSMIFLWVFLPAVILLYYLVPKKGKNAVLLAASLVFYSWGEPLYIFLMLFSVTVNYFFGLWLDRYKKWYILLLCLLFNLGVLGYFKYYNLMAQFLHGVFGRELISMREIALPLGISFYTFQTLSYVIDVYRGRIDVQKNFFRLLLYISFFPQLIAGPIVKYKDVKDQMIDREHNVMKMSYGIKRFIYGLGKKVLISNTMAYYADLIMDCNINELSSGGAWLGAILYTLQIYFDFSGYSDMAIGLGKIFGFDFQENFNYPYLAVSVQDFWRRWHISLSTWFKEYVYIPLGGNRKGTFRTYVNLFLVFFLTGLWHGAGYNFIFWGLYHGFFLIIERIFLGDLLKKNKLKILNHIYTMAVVIVGWVFFRLDMDAALLYVKKMFHFSSGLYQINNMLSLKLILFLGAAILLSGIHIKIPHLKKQLYNETAVSIKEMALLFVILFFCVVMLVSDMYNPFIYFRF